MAGAGGVSATGVSAGSSAAKRKEDWPQAVAVKKTANKAMPARLVILISNTPLRMKTSVAGKGLLFVGIRVSWRSLESSL